MRAKLGARNSGEAEARDGRSVADACRRQGYASCEVFFDTKAGAISAAEQAAAIGVTSVISLGRDVHLVRSQNRVWRMARPRWMTPCIHVSI